MRSIQYWWKFAKIFRLHWEYHWAYHHPKTSQKVQAMEKVECLRDKARFRIRESDDTLHEFQVFSPKESEGNTNFLFLVDEEANAYTSIPEGWQLMGLDGPEERADVVGFLDGKRYLFEGGSNKLLAVAEE
ncbi:hypothetical protein C6503_05095 [Candidatus Poribacteria bacterium]|nr:MAG: hypothetical protein C6503_05095 [Candidatus Poribacteria bacterium]